MDVLQAHRERVRALQAAVDELMALHAERYDVWSEIVRLNQADAPERYPRIEALHDQAFSLAERIGRRRAESFGTLSHEARLMLRSEVESGGPGAFSLAEPPLSE